MKVCPTPGCPTLIPVKARHCVPCAQDCERARGTRQQRGYDAEHDRLRKRYAHKVASGTAFCARCRQPITPGQSWHLDHTDDRTGYLGASHALCNLSTAGRAAHG